MMAAVEERRGERGSGVGRESRLTWGKSDDELDFAVGGAKTAADVQMPIR